MGVISVKRVSDNKSSNNLTGGTAVESQKETVLDRTMEDTKREKENRAKTVFQLIFRLQLMRQGFIHIHTVQHVIIPMYLTKQMLLQKITNIRHSNRLLANLTEPDSLVQRILLICLWFH